MSVKPQHFDSELEQRVAERYRQLGFEVIVGPKAEDLPFDLGPYRPDLVVRKSKHEGYIVEIKGTHLRIPVERYQEIAEIVSQHTGWRFLLITGEDAIKGIQELEGDLPTWETLLRRKQEADQLVLAGQSEGAFLVLWALLEASMRIRAEQASLPVGRLPTLPLIKHLYSQGELSMSQFDSTIKLLDIRNRLVHGIDEVAPSRTGWLPRPTLRSHWVHRFPLRPPMWRPGYRFHAGERPASQSLSPPP